ncbi:hypothetical protein Tco_0074471 [Tanacetum coccineum]
MIASIRVAEAVLISFSLSGTPGLDPVPSLEAPVLDESEDLFFDKIKESLKAKQFVASVLIGGGMISDGSDH